MAKIKIKIRDNEIEIDSRDFYIDNESIGEVISHVTKLLQENAEKISPSTIQEIQSNSYDSISKHDMLSSLEDVETFEPEFSEPISIDGFEVMNKIKILEAKSFFTTPRTVSETVEQLREYGWLASPLDVSKSLVKLTSNGEILHNSHENKNYYFTKEALLTT